MTVNTMKMIDFAWMSQAAYRGFQENDRGDPAALRRDLTGAEPLGINNRFASDQAAAFTSLTTGYSLESHQPNDATGFSATVFKSNADSSYTIAVRGTEPNSLTDLLNADLLGVVLSGWGTKGVRDELFLESKPTL